MAPKSRLKFVRSLDNKTTPDLTFSPRNRHAPNRPSDVRYQGVQKDYHENRGKHFSIQFDGQQIHVEETRSSSLVAEGNVQSNRPHLTQSNGSMHCNTFTGFPDVQSNRPHLAQSNGSMHCNTLTGFPDFVSRKRRTIQHPRTLGTTFNGAEDVQPTQAPSGTTDCPHRLSDEVQEGNFENIHENNSMHTGSSPTTTSKVKRTRGPLSKSACKPPNGQKWKCMFIHRQPVGVEASKLAEVLGLYARNDNYFPPYKDWREQSKQSLNDVMKELLEKVITTCDERNLTNSSEPSVLTPVLDAIYNGHHGGFERGCGLGWSRAAWNHNMANEERNDNIRRLTVDLENTQSELQNAMAEIQDMRAREREMEARQQEYMEALRAREKELEVRQQEQAEAMLAREREMQMRLAHMEAMVSMSLPNASVGDYRFRSGTSCSHPPS